MGSLGPYGGKDVSSPAPILSSLHNISATASGNSLFLFQDGNPRFSGFDNNALLLTTGTSEGHLILSGFSATIFGAGVQIQSALPGDYVAHLAVYGTSNLSDPLHIFQVLGHFNGSVPETQEAKFIGFVGTEAISKIELWTDNGGAASDFAVNNPYVRTSAVPLPGTVWLMSIGLLGVLPRARRFFSKK